MSAARLLVTGRKLRPLCLLTPQALEEFQGVAVEEPNAVLVGTAPQEMHYERLNEALQVLMREGSELIAEPRSVGWAFKAREAFGHGSMALCKVFRPRRGTKPE